MGVLQDYLGTGRMDVRARGLASNRILCMVNDIYLTHLCSMSTYHASLHQALLYVAHMYMISESPAFRQLSALLQGDMTAPTAQPLHSVEVQ
jgi:hypothetical protein